MRRIAILLVLASCTEHGKSPGDGGPAPFVDDSDPTHCTLVTMRVFDNLTRIIGPFTLGATTACVHLDPMGSAFSHFAAQTGHELGTESSFTLTLTDLSGAVIQRGADVTIGLEASRTFASVELTFDSPTVPDLILHIDAKLGKRAPTAVTLTYQMPLD